MIFPSDRLSQNALADLIMTTWELFDPKRSSMSTWVQPVDDLRLDDHCWAHLINNTVSKSHGRGTGGESPTAARNPAWGGEELATPRAQGENTTRPAETRKKNLMY